MTPSLILSHCIDDLNGHYGRIFLLPYNDELNVSQYFQQVGEGSCTLGNLTPSTTYEAIVQVTITYTPNQTLFLKKGFSGTT